MVCVSVGDACNPARHLWIGKQSNGKPIITWDKPTHYDGLTGYYVYRKCNANGEYQIVKAVSPNKNEYKESNMLEHGNWYYYKVLAYYSDIDCYSIPAKSMYGNEYFVKVYYSPESVDENDIQNIEIYPNPAKDQLTIKAENLTNVMVYNAVGQKILEQGLNADEVTLNTSELDSGIYFVKITSNGIEMTKRISIIK